MIQFSFLGLTEIAQDIEDIRPPIAQHSLWGIVGILPTPFGRTEKRSFCPPACPRNGRTQN
jgi:hypothetical protein